MFSQGNTGYDKTAYERHLTLRSRSEKTSFLSIKLKESEESSRKRERKCPERGSSIWKTPEVREPGAFIK